MAQQTQVERVVPYYERFVAQLPTAEDLASSPLATVLSLWSGLGYNSRAKRLHECGQAIASQGWPESIEGLMTLPGIGPYTARAIAAFALGHQTVPVDTNVRRVLSRWHGEPLQGVPLQAIAEADAAGADASLWTQAIMDLGSTLCTPRRPRCGVCPVALWCAGPDVYVPPRPQPRFEGSARQLRGSIIRRLVDGPATTADLAAHSGFPLHGVEETLVDLDAEGLITTSGDRYRLPE